MLAGLGTIDDDQTIHLRHGIIRKQQVYRPLSLEDLEGEGGIFSFPYCIAAVAQERCNETPHVCIIVANQDSRLARFRNGLVRLQIAALNRLAFGAWQPQIHLCALVERTGDVNRSTRLRGKAVDDRQSQAGTTAYLLRRKERFEGT